MNTFNSFNKGEAFEDYLQNVIFPKEKYALIHRTHNHHQNATRFVEESLKPDFKFRCLKSGLEFYVEAKYRSDFFQDKLTVMNIEQFERFKIINEECPVFIAIGYGGYPNRPEGISLLSIEQLQYLSLYRSVVNKFAIDKYKAIDSDEMLNRFGKYFKKPQATKLIVEEKPVSKKQIINRKLIVGLVLFIAVISGFLFYQNNTTHLRNQQEVAIGDNREKRLKKTIDSYYDALRNNNPEVLDYYVSDNVDRWFSRQDVSLAYVKNDTRRYLGKYPFHEYKIRWITFNYTVLPNGDFNVSYMLDYKIKSKNAVAYKAYYLRIKSIWSSDFKLKSIYEEKVR